MTTPPVYLVRPEPSRGLGAFYRNLGFSVVAAHLRLHDLEPRLVDLSFDDLHTAMDGAEGVALFSLYIDDFAEGMAVAHQLKQTGRFVTFVGGPHATLLGSSLLDIDAAFDVVGVGDCLPEAMPLIAAAAHGLIPPGRHVVRAPDAAARMDPLAPDYSIWPENRYFPVFPVEMSRGCRQRCPFCTDPVLRRGLAIDPVTRTMATIKELVNAHGRIWIRFVDSSMSSLGGDLQGLLDALVDAELPVEWSAYAYPHDITPGLAERMAAAGCRALFLGIESLGDGVRVGKHHTKRPHEVARAVDALHEYGIFVHGNFIIGLPGETADTVAQTLAGLAMIQFDSVGGGPFFLTPGSTFERSPEKFGIEILDPGWPLRQHTNFYESAHEYFRTATLTQREMRELAAAFRVRVQDDRLACWNLSDYAALCWLSVGGDLADLVRLWQLDDTQLTGEQRLVLGVLKEKTGVSATDTAGRFVNVAAAVAASARAVPA